MTDEEKKLIEKIASELSWIVFWLNCIASGVMGIAMLLLVFLVFWK